MSAAVSQAELSHSFNDRKLSIELLTCHLAFGEPEVSLTDVKLPRTLRKLHFERLFKVALAKVRTSRWTSGTYSYTPSVLGFIFVSKPGSYFSF